MIRGQTASNGAGLHGHEATSTAQSIMAALTAGEWQGQVGQDIIGAGSWPVFGIQGHWVGWVHRVVPVTLAYLAGHVRMSAATQQNKAGVAMCYGGVWRHLVHVTACARGCLDSGLSGPCDMAAVVAVDGHTRFSGGMHALHAP